MQGSGCGRYCGQSWEGGSGHAGVAEQACLAVVYLGTNNAEIEVLIEQAGGIPRLLAALGNHAQHSEVMQQAYWALLAALDNHAQHSEVMQQT